MKIPESPDAFTTIGVLASPPTPTTSTPTIFTPVASPATATKESNALKIGVGVGLSLMGIFLLCAVWYIFKQRRQLKRLVKELSGFSTRRQGFTKIPPQAPQNFLDRMPPGLIYQDDTTSTHSGHIIQMPELHSDRSSVPELSTNTHV